MLLSPLSSSLDPIAFPRHDSRSRLKEGEICTIYLLKNERHTTARATVTTSLKNLENLCVFLLTCCGWCFNIRDSVLISETLCTWTVHHPHMIHVELVAAQNNIGCLAVCMNFQLLHPALDFEKRALIGDVKHEEKSHRITKEWCCEGAKSLLTGCVPQLEMNPMIDSIDIVKL